MPNSSDTFKTGERVLQEGEYHCLICRQMGKSTALQAAKGQIFPHCEACESKDATYRLAAKGVTK
jgi:hypothetical protein